MLFALWIATVLFTLVGSWLALRKRMPAQIKARLPGITVLKPLCGHDSGLRQNLESFFRQKYPAFELIFSVNDPADPAVPLVEELQKKYPKVPSWLVLGGVHVGPNPKVNNLVRSYELATYDLILISDSNVRVEPDYLLRMAPELEEGVGVVTSIVAGTSPQGLGAELECAYLNTFYARGMNLAFATGNPCVIGKSMLFRKSVAAAFGGIRALGGYLAEDYALGEEMRKLGLSVALAADPIPQFVGKYSLLSFWQRHIRWGRIRKSHAPFAFLLEPVFSPILSSLLAGLAWQGSFPFLQAFGLNLLFCLACDLQLLRKFSRRQDLWAPCIWLARELLAFPLWIAAAAGNTVQWRGQVLTLQVGGLIGGEIDSGEMECVSSFGERQPLHIRSRATTRPATGGIGSQTAI